MMRLRVESFGCLLHGVHLASWIYGFVRFLKFGKFWPLFLQIYLVLSHRSLELCSFFFLLFPVYSSNLSLSNDLSSHLLIFSPPSSNVLLSPFSDIFISVIVLFNSRISFCFIFRFYLFIDISILFSHHLLIFLCLVDLVSVFLFVCLFVFLPFLGLLLQHMEVPRLGV